MKILLLTDHALTWDQAPPSRLLNLGRELARDGHEVRVAGAPHDGGSPRVDGVTVIPLPHRADGGLRQALFPLRKAVGEQVRWCDALIVRGYWIALWAFCHAALAGCRLRLYEYHGLNAAEQWIDRRRVRSVFTWCVEQLDFALATHFIAAGRAFHDQLAARYRGRSCVLENGVDTERLAAARPGADRVAALRRRWDLRPGMPVATLVAHFGSWLEPEVVVRAAALVSDAIDLLVVGDGRGLAAAREEQRRAGAANVRFTGALPHGDVCELLAMSAACICPYRASWPLARQPDFFVSRKVKEYLAAGKPVICPDIPGRGPILRDGETCLLYRPGDSDDLARRLRDLVQQPDLAERLGRRGRELAEQFSWSRLYRESGLADLLREGRA